MANAASLAATGVLANAQVNIVIPLAGLKTSVSKIKAHLTGIGASADKSQGKFMRFGKMVSHTMLRIGAAMLIFKGISFLKRITDDAMKFEFKMREVATLMGGDWRNDIGKLSTEMLHTSIEYGMGIDNLVESLYKFKSAGMKTATVLQDVKNAALLAQVTTADTITATDALARTMNAFKIPTENANRAVDALFATVKYGNIRLEDMHQGMGKLIASGSLVTDSFEEVLATFAPISQVLPAREAFTGLANLFLSLVRPTNDIKQAAADLGISWDYLTLRKEGLGNWLRKLKGLSLEQIAAFTAEKRAARALIVALDMIPEIEHQLKETMNATNLALKERVKLMESYEHRARQMESAQKAMDITAGKHMAPMAMAAKYEWLKVKARALSFVDEKAARDMMMEFYKAYLTGIPKQKVLPSGELDWKTDMELQNAIPAQMWLDMWPGLEMPGGGYEKAVKATKAFPLYRALFDRALNRNPRITPKFGSLREYLFTEEAVRTDLQGQSSGARKSALEEANRKATEMSKLFDSYTPGAKYYPSPLGTSPEAVAELKKIRKAIEGNTRENPPAASLRGSGTKRQIMFGRRVFRD